MLLSRMINDPSWRLQPNRLGRTVGLVFYTPKFWNCREHDFMRSHLDDDFAPSEETLADRRQRAEDHSRCRWPYRHLSYKGYTYWIGPRRRYEFYYMGHPGYGPEHGLFRVIKHATHVRWRRAD